MSRKAAKQGIYCHDCCNTKKSKIMKKWKVYFGEKLFIVYAKTGFDAIDRALLQKEEYLRKILNAYWKNLK